MDVFLMVRRRKTTIFLDSKENNTVLDVKKQLHGITKKPLEDIKIYHNDMPLEDNKTLSEYGIVSGSARAQAPAALGMVFRQEESNDFEALEIAPLSTPPELPEVMKPQESSSSSHAPEKVAT